MAFLKFVNCNFPKLLCIKNTLTSSETRVIAAGHLLTHERFARRKGYGRILKMMNTRRKLFGPDKVRKRSDWDNWNYKSELYCFNKRLYENISEETLRWAFIHESYIEEAEQKRKALDIPSQNVTLDLKPNTSLITSGREITSDFVKRYLRLSFPLLPEEGIIAVHDYLLSDSLLAYVSSNLGTKDLILSSDFPHEKKTLANTLLAVIGAITHDDSRIKAENFVLDFICMQLVSKDVFDIWDLKDPSNVLNSILVKHGMSEYEPRLIFESGRNTIESIYSVGLYTDKIFLGRGTGETLVIAEELAAFDCLRKIFQIRESEKPVSSEKISVSDLSNLTLENPCIENWYSETLKVTKCLESH